ALDHFDGPLQRQDLEVDLAVIVQTLLGQVLLGLRVDHLADDQVVTGGVRVHDLIAHEDLIDFRYRRGLHVEYVGTRKSRLDILSNRGRNIRLGGRGGRRGGEIQQRRECQGVNENAAPAARDCLNSLI